MSEGDIEVRGNVGRDLELFQDALMGHLQAAGLPTDGVLVDVYERSVAVGNLEPVLRHIGPRQRARSLYISKMVAAASVGLFDAALNYLWDETISELRARIVGYDLSYFFDVAVKSPERRKHLRYAADLDKVDDVELLRAAKEIGLLSDVGHSQLDGVRYMRNHASAAHPNQVEFSGVQLVGWFDICVRQAITLPLDTTTAETSKLLANIRSQELTAEMVEGTAVFFDRLDPSKSDVLAQGLFGLYVDPSAEAIAKDNVRRLWPKLWPYVPEDRRHEFGTRLARYLANADHVQAESARELLDLVGGTSYLPTALRVVELAEAIDALEAAHHGWDNFYREAAPAKRLASVVGEMGTVPLDLEARYLGVVTEAFLGNGSGISTAAEPHYRTILSRIGPRLAGQVLRLLGDDTIASRLQTRVGREQWAELLELLDPKMTRPDDQALFQAIRDFGGQPDQLRRSPEIRRLAGLE